MDNNSVELVGYYGGDKTNLYPHISGDDLDNSQKRREKLQILKKNNDIESFKLSSLHFLMNIDLVSFYYIINNFDVTFIEREENNNYYIPNEFCNQQSSEDVLDINGNLFLEKGKTFYDAIYNYTHLGKELQNRLELDTKNITPVGRTNNTTQYLTPFNKLKNIDIIFNFKTFIRFIQESYKSEVSIEIKEIAFDMLELVNNIYQKPFTSTLTVFNLK